MEDWISKFLDAVGIRHDGPMAFRIILQPTMSLIYAIVAGVRDAKAGRKPLLEAFIFGDTERSRKDILKEIWKDIGKVFILAVIMEVIFEIIEFKTVHPLAVLRVAFWLAIVPYMIMRGPVERIVEMFFNKKK
ncbi:MAG: hypothetical protein KBF96_07695 [Ignavibacteria bacterium]|jgi:hypothetical protein|nr:hypothetical protein [Ignavibacteria bacterium]